MRFFNKGSLVKAAVGLAVLGGGTAAAITTSGPASAAAGIELCISSPTSGCANAWGGGPYVNVWVGGYTTNNLFRQITVPSQGVWEFEFVGGGGMTGDCIGDEGNQSGNARAGLVGCPNSGPAGWGSLIDVQGCSNGGTALFDRHWGGYVAPAAGSGNGRAIYLNQAAVYCWQAYSVG